MVSSTQPPLGGRVHTRNSWSHGIRAVAAHRPPSAPYLTQTRPGAVSPMLNTASSFLGNAALSVFPFFFQAEDGIRDLIVTGVQTCALQISLSTQYQIWLRRRGDNPSGMQQW